MNATEFLFLLTAMFGAGEGDPNLYREMAVLVHSASAEQVNQLVIEGDFPRAMFSLHGASIEGVSSTTAVKDGKFTLRFPEDYTENNIDVSFKYDSSGREFAFYPEAEEFLEDLSDALPLLRNHLYFAESDGKPQASLSIERVKENPKDLNVSFYVLPRIPKEVPKQDAQTQQTVTKIEYEYPVADSSIIVEIAHRDTIRARVEALMAASVVQKTPAQSAQAQQAAPINPAWQLSAQEYAKHFDMLPISIEIQNETAGQANLAPIRPLERVVNSQHFQQKGLLVNPRSNTTGSFPLQTVSKEVSSRTKANEITDFTMDAEDFISEVLGPVISDRPSYYECWVTNASDSACSKGSKNEDGSSNDTIRIYSESKKSLWKGKSENFNTFRIRGDGKTYIYKVTIKTNVPFTLTSDTKAPISRRE